MFIVSLRHIVQKRINSTRWMTVSSDLKPVSSVVVNFDKIIIEVPTLNHSVFDMTTCWHFITHYHEFHQKHNPKSALFSEKYLLLNRFGSQYPITHPPSRPSSKIKKCLFVFFSQVMKHFSMYWTKILCKYWRQSEEVSWTS